MESKQDYLRRLKNAVERLHNCAARHCMSVAIHQEVQGQTVWKGNVEVFDITGNPRASICYAWSQAGNDGQDRLVAILGIPPAISPLEAVRAHIAADAGSKGD